MSREAAPHGYRILHRQREIANFLSELPYRHNLAAAADYMVCIIIERPTEIEQGARPPVFARKSSPLYNNWAPITIPLDRCLN